MGVASASEHKIGPFDYEDAVECIKESALVLTNLGLHERFSVDPVPRRGMEFEKRRDGKKGRRNIYYEVVLFDKHPDQPKPYELTELAIRQAAFKGYVKGYVVPQQNEACAELPPGQYEAFGQRKTLSKWAQVAGVSCPTLKARVDAGMTVEEAITEIALKRASRMAS